MRILIFRNPSRVSQSELELDLTLLPKWRKEKVLSYRFLIDRVLCAKAYLLLCQGLREEYGITDKPEFDFGVNGKPVLKSYPNIHFNLSHCRKGVMCALDNNEIGCDIEEIYEKVDDDLCNHCFNIEEKRQILSPVDFSRFWTMKEAYLKYTGKGLVDNLQSLLTMDVMQRVSFITKINEEDKFVISVCSGDR